MARSCPGPVELVDEPKRQLARGDTMALSGGQRFTRTKWDDDQGVSRRRPRSIGNSATWGLARGADLYPCLGFAGSLGGN